MTKGLKSSNTKWILFLSSDSEPEDRHVYDLAFGLKCLEDAGISASDISIYIDGSDRSHLSSQMALGSQNNHAIKKTFDFFSDLNHNDVENIVLFVTGHGSIQGIAAAPPIKPHALVNAIKAAPGLTRAVIYLGQCYAGIFNYVKAGSQGKGDPCVILAGATNLHSSLSSSTTEQLVGGDVTWPANLFLLHAFKWITSPTDVDGDGRATVIDSFKYAGAMSNDDNKRLKGGFTYSLPSLHQDHENALYKFRSTNDQNDELSLKAAEAKYVQALDILHTHQESWILNSIPAQLVEF